jgi:hypothetical protein
VVALYEQLRVSLLSGEGEAAVAEAEEVLLLVVDEIREAHFVQHHFEPVERLGFFSALAKLPRRLGPLLAIHAYAPTSNDT